MIDTSFQAAALAAALFEPAGTVPPCTLWQDLRETLAERALAEACVNADLRDLPADCDGDAFEAHLGRCEAHYEAMMAREAEIGQILDCMALQGLLDEIGQYLSVTYGG